MKRFTLLVGMMVIFTAPVFGTEQAQTLTELVDDADVLVITADNSNLTVNGQRGLEEIRVTATLSGKKTDKDMIRSLLNSALTIDIRNQHGQITLRSTFDKSRARLEAGRDLQVHVQVDVPKVFNVDLEHRKGTANIRNISGKVTILQGSGDLYVEEILGTANITDGDGDLMVESIGGTLAIVDEAGDMVVERINGDVEITDGSGDIATKWVHGNVHISDGDGEITVAEVTGDVDILENGTGNVQVAGVRGQVRDNS